MYPVSPCFAVMQFYISNSMFLQNVKVLFKMSFASLIQRSLIFLPPRKITCKPSNDRAKAIFFRRSIISYDVVFVNFFLNL